MSSIQKYGFSALNDYLNSNQSNLSDRNLKELKEFSIPARVIDVILDENHPDFKENGSWNSIGSIKFELIYNIDSFNRNSLVAKPLLPNIKYYPLKNEIVLLFKLPDDLIGELNNNSNYYYLNVLSIWNHPHHNAYPNPILNPEDITETELNVSNISGGEFIEKNNINPLLPFSGDNIIEGRFGNSIRLGSTNRSNDAILNSWSSFGEKGNPITIIKNGQDPNISTPSYQHIIEDINKDLSSIYITSNQKIPIEISYEEFSGLKEPPISPPEYANSQILLNSDRVLLNAKNDGILLSGNKFISLNSRNEIGITSRKNISLSANNINLGSTEANEQVPLGNSLLKQLEKLTSNIINVLEVLDNTLKYFPGGLPSPHPAPILYAESKEKIQEVLNELKNNKLLSKVTRTI
jgi:hypothetical protein